MDMFKHVLTCLDMSAHCIYAIYASVKDTSSRFFKITIHKMHLAQFVQACSSLSKLGSNIYV